jgi:hypothetical protein
MPALQRAAATSAMSAMDVELTNDGPPRDLGLMLKDDVVFAKIVGAAVRAVGRELGLEGLVDAIGRRPMSVGAVLIAGFSARRLGILSRRTFGEGSGLPFGGPLALFESGGETPNEFGETPNFRFEFVDASPEGLWVGAGVIHAASVANDDSFSCASLP